MVKGYWEEVCINHVKLACEQLQGKCCADIVLELVCSRILACLLTERLCEKRHYRSSEWKGRWGAYQINKSCAAKT